MQLESHATPPRETPQQRYANLHRAIERGLDSDEIWKELADVSLSLGHGDEAVMCMRRIKGDTVRLALESRLARLGLVLPPSAAENPSAAPAASSAGTKPGTQGPGSEPGHRLADHVVDAFQYLFHQHMPWLVVLTTLAFPLVVGVGGFLTAGGSLLLLAAIAALPGLCVLGVVGAMGRQILLASAEGSGDVPPIPAFAHLVADARRFLADQGLVIGALLGPGLLAAALGAPLSTTLPGLLIGAFFAPMAWALRQVRGDLGSLSPVTLVRAVARGGLGYAGLAGVTCGLFAPAALVTWGVFGRPVWVLIAVVGPLCVLPVFVASRLLGTWLDEKRMDLRLLLLATPRRTANAGAKAAAGAASKPAPSKVAATTAAATKAPATRAAARRPGQAKAVRQPRRPEALDHFRAPVGKRLDPRALPKAAAPATPSPGARPESRPRAPAPAAPAPAAPRAAAPAGRAATPPPAAAARPAPRAIEGRAPAGPDDGPDLTHLPGAVVLTGNDRQRHGAAARRP